MKCKQCNKKINNISEQKHMFGGIIFNVECHGKTAIICLSHIDDKERIVIDFEEEMGNF